MIRARFRVTFETITPESVENGDTADSGFIYEDGTNLREAIRACGFYPHARVPGHGLFEDSGSWFSTIDADQNYRTGEETRYAIHPPRGITRASYGRLRRYLTGR